MDFKSKDHNHLHSANAWKYKQNRLQSSIVQTCLSNKNCLQLLLVNDH